MSGTADEVLRAHGFSGERLLKLCRKIANDELARRGAFLDEGRMEDLVGFLALHGVRASVRYEPERVHAKYGANGGDPFASWLADILAYRVTDWYRSKAEGWGDRRKGFDNRIVLAGDKIDDDPDPDDAFEYEFALRRAEQGVDFDEAETELGFGLSNEAREGLRLARLRAQGYQIPNEGWRRRNGNRPLLTTTGRALDAARRELAPLVLSRPQKRQPIRRTTVATIVQKPPLLAIPDVSARINFSEKTVRRLIARGELPAIRPGGERGRIRVDQDELERWLATRKTAA